jgi:hypothetical protein
MLSDPCPRHHKPADEKYLIETHPSIVRHIPTAFAFWVRLKPIGSPVPS